MERVHSAIAYPRNFFGVLSALLIEDSPVTQDRVMQLTGYSRATVSLSLQKIQLVMSVHVTKIQSDRRNYYSFGGCPEDFILRIMEARTDAPDIDVDATAFLAEKAEARIPQDDSYKRLSKHFLEVTQLVSAIFDVRKRSIGPLAKALRRNGVEGVVISASLKQELSRLKAFQKVSYDVNGDEKDLSEKEDPSGYLELKQEYFHVLRRSLNPLYSQRLAHRLVVIHDVMIEGTTTQEQIRDSTGLPRSTVSEQLRLGVDEGILQVETIEGSRVKQYRPGVSLVELLMAHYRRSAVYAATVSDKIQSLVRKLDDNEDETKRLRERLRQLERAYETLAEFTRRVWSAVVE